MNEGKPLDEQAFMALAGEPETTRATIFVSDASAEAEHVAQMLRVAGYLVVDVPMSLLLARVDAQTPNVILIDADAEGAAEIAANVRATTEDTARIDVLFFGDAKTEGLHASEPSRFFARPIDPLALVRRIDTLTGGPSSGAPDPGRRSSVPSSAPPHAAPLSGRPPSSKPMRDPPVSARSLRPAISISMLLSPELEALLRDAERRVGSEATHEAPPPTPEEELEAVLPLALLAALDEPLEEDNEDLAEAGSVPSRESVHDGRAGMGGTPALTHAGIGLTPPPAHNPLEESFGVAPTMKAPPVLAPDPVLPLEGPAPPHAAQVGAADFLFTDEVIRVGDAARLLGEAVATHGSAAFSFESPEGLRHVVIRDGDIVTAASGADDETLLAFMTARGDLHREDVRELVGKVPPFGRHAGAALIGHGLVRQDHLWPMLRAHAEWVLGRTLLITSGTARATLEAPGRLRQEPGVFGGSSGAEVLVEILRRVIAPEEALRRLGGRAAVIAEGPGGLLSECALDPQEREIVENARGLTLGDVTARAGGPDILSALYALSLLRIIVVAKAIPLSPSTRGREEDDETPGAAADALDLTALREQVRARKELVIEADYFTLLGVARDATGYEVRRAYLELRRAFEPARILTPEIADLDGDVRTIVLVLDEAYDILRDSARRDRYRRALGDAP